MVQVKFSSRVISNSRNVFVSGYSQWLLRIWVVCRLMVVSMYQCSWGMQVMVKSCWWLLRLVYRQCIELVLVWVRCMVLCRVLCCFGWLSRLNIWWCLLVLLVVELQVIRWWFGWVWMVLLLLMIIGVMFGLWVMMKLLRKLFRFRLLLVRLMGWFWLWIIRLNQILVRFSLLLILMLMLQVVLLCRVLKYQVFFGLLVFRVQCGCLLQGWLLLLKQQCWELLVMMKQVWLWKLLWQFLVLWKNSVWCVGLFFFSSQLWVIIDLVKWCDNVSLWEIGVRIFCWCSRVKFFVQVRLKCVWMLFIVCQFSSIVGISVRVQVSNSVIIDLLCNFQFVVMVIFISFLFGLWLKLWIESVC